MKKILRKITYIIFIVFIVIAVKLLFFNIYKIPSSSMENELFTSDVIVVNKLKYGPRLPRSPFDIPIVNIPFYFNEKAKKRIKEYWWPYKRFSGTSNITQGDIIVFNSTWKKDFILVKRCIGLPKDTLVIKEATIFRNDTPFIEPNTVKKEYTFTPKDNKKSFANTIDSLELDVAYQNRESFVKGFLTKHQLDYLTKAELIELVKDTIIQKRKTRTFDKTKTLAWTINNMGPFIVPYKGMKIELNLINFFKYRRAINSC